MQIPIITNNISDNKFNNLRIIKPNILSFKANSFKQTFDKMFFNKLLKEGLPCAYTNIPLISQFDLNVIKNVQEMNIPLNLDFNYLKKYKGQLLKRENQLLEILEKEFDKNPNCDFNQIIEKIFPTLENDLQKYQAKIITNALLIAKDLPKYEYHHVAEILTDSFKDIFNLDSSMRPSENYLIARIKALEIEDDKTCNKIYKELHKLTLNKVVDGYIIKNKRNNTLNEQNIIFKLLELCASTIEHIHPQVSHRNEIYNPNNNRPKNSNMIVILSNYYINQQKADIPFDDFIKQSPFPVKKNLQKHVNRLIEIFEKWKNENKTQDSELLSLYILCLKKELEKRASKLKINIEMLKKMIPENIFKQRKKKINEFF